MARASPFRVPSLQKITHPRPTRPEMHPPPPPPPHYPRVLPPLSYSPHLAQCVACCSGMAGLVGDTKPYEYYLDLETWEGVAAESKTQDPSASLNEPPMQLLTRFLPYFQPSLKPQSVCGARAPEGPPVRDPAVDGGGCGRRMVALAEFAVGISPTGRH